MSDKSAIEWTDATWNPVTGCTEVSPGCDNCYAKTFAERFRGTSGHYFEQGFDMVLRPEKLDEPLRWKKPRRVFVNSMSDLFHDSVPDKFIFDVFARMWWAPKHTFQLLTKRHARMRSLMPRIYESLRRRESDLALVDCPTPLPWPLPNLWVGVSVENQQWADIRIPALLDTPAAVRWLSCEPLLGPVQLHSDWLVPRVGCLRGAGSMTTADTGALSKVLRAAVRFTSRRTQPIRRDSWTGLLSVASPAVPPDRCIPTGRGHYETAVLRPASRSSSSSGASGANPAKCLRTRGCV